jgi:MtrB/PioB family decaheme-associated outer membrane protein
MYKKHDFPVRRPTRIALAVAAALAAASGAAVAEPLQQVTLYRNADMTRWSDNYFEFGGLYNGAIDVGATPNNSFKFGEFSGLRKEGLYGVLNFNWITRDREDDAKYSQVYGENVGLASKFFLDAGHQGDWRLVLGVDRLTRYETDTAKFLHEGLGTDALTLPSGFARVGDATQVNPGAFKNFDISQTREIFRVGTSGLLGNNWDYKVSFREDRREGSRLTGVAFATTPTQAVIVPYPIDDHTQQVEAQLSYATKVAQFQLGYAYSRFEDSVDSFRIDNPFSTGTAVGRMSLMPDNDYHQVSALGGYNFTRVTRFQAQASYAVGRQNDPFLRYSEALPNYLPAVASLDGKVIKSLIDLNLMTRPNEKSNLKFGYQFRDNDNQTPINQYFYVSRDGAAIPGTNAATTRTNVPLSTTERKFVIDGDYEIAPRTLVRAELENRRVNYQLTDRAETDTRKATLELRRPVSPDFIGNVGYIYTQRTGSEYDKSVFFRNSYTGYTSPGDQAFYNANRIDNHPSLRSFMYSDYRENRGRAGASWTVDETLSLQGSLDGYQQHYRGPDCDGAAFGIVNATTATPFPDTCLGRTEAEGASAHFDVQWQPDEAVMAFAFGDIAQTQYDLRGRPWGRNNAAAQGADATRDFFDGMKYRDITAGLGVKWQPERWDVGAQYIFNRGVGKTSVVLASGSAVVPVPDTENRTHSVQLYAKWNQSKLVTWRLNYWIERLMSKDWLYDGLTATSTPNVSLTGQTSPNYWNHVIGLSVAFSSD